MPFEPTKKIWMNGEFVDWDEATVHFLTPTLHYGWGVFEGIRAYATKDGTAVFRLSDHIKRLFASARIYLMEPDFTVEEVVAATKETVRINGLEAGYVRPLMFLGYGEMGLNPLPSKVEVGIACWPWGVYLGQEAMEKGARVAVSSWQRIGMNTIPPAGKATGQYINSSLAKVAALKAGYDEAIMLNPNGTVAEGSGENIFVVSDGTLVTPPIVDGVLAGLTRDSIITLATERGMAVSERSIVRSELYLADEVFFTGTAAEVVPVTEVDDRPVGTGRPGPVTRQLMQDYHRATTGDLPEHAEWCEYV